MTRPEPRPSSLAGATPLRRLAPRDAPEPGREPPTKVARSKVGFTQSVANANRARAALLHTQVSEGQCSLSDFIDTAVMREVERLEKLHNNGRPFGEGPVGHMSPGPFPKPLT